MCLVVPTTSHNFYNSQNIIEPQAQWIAILEQQGILCKGINTYSDATLDPQTQANNMVVDLELRPELPLHTFGTPIRLYHTPSNTPYTTAIRF